MSGLPEVGFTFSYEDVDHEPWCSVSGVYRVMGYEGPDRLGGMAVRVEALDVENWPGTGTIYNWGEQVESGLIKEMSAWTA